MWNRIRLALLLAFLVHPPAIAPVKVDLELILMADCSGSIDNEEFLLQRHGYARALRDPRVMDAIRYGRLGRIALSYVEWSGPDLHVPIVPWTMIRTEADIAAFAEVLVQRPRELYGGGTAIGDAILYGAASLATNGFEGRRRRHRRFGRWFRQERTARRHWARSSGGPGGDGERLADPRGVIVAERILH
jgi:hypothetical protein